MIRKNKKFMSVYNHKTFKYDIMFFKSEGKTLYKGVIESFHLLSEAKIFLKFIKKNAFITIENNKEIVSCPSVQTLFKEDKIKDNCPNVREVKIDEEVSNIDEEIIKKVENNNKILEKKKKELEKIKNG